MKYLLLAAFTLLLRSVSASEPTPVGGFYLGQQPISVEHAFRIMVQKENFHELPNLSVVEPLTVDDFRLLVQAVSVAQICSFHELERLWGQWANFLQLSDEHPSIRQSQLLQRYLFEACIACLKERIAKDQASDRLARKEGPFHLGNWIDSFFQPMGLFATFLLLLLSLCYEFAG